MAEAHLGPLRVRAEARATRDGLIALGVATSGVLLSAALLAWALRRPAKGRPVSSG